MAKSILITHAFGPQNRGDHELLQKLISIIQKKYEGRAAITVLTTYPDLSTNNIAGATFERSPFFRPSNLFEWICLIYDLPIWCISLRTGFLSRLLSPRRRRCYEIARKSDVIYMCPGGYLFSNKTALYTNLVNGMLYMQKGKTKVAAPMSIGPFDSKVDQFLCKLIIKNIDSVLVRESYSYNLVQKMGLRPAAVPDLAWLKDEDVTACEDRSWEGRFIGTVIDWSYPGSKNIGSMKQRYISQFAAIAKYIFEVTGNPMIIYNQVGDGAGDSLDEKLIEKIVKESSGSAVYDPTAMSPSILKSRMKYCAGVVASRFHSALFSIQAGCPLVVISYQPKAKYILKDVGLPQISRDIENFDGREMAEKIIDYAKNRDHWERLFSKISSISDKKIRQTFLIVNK